jgi:23S rRNA pseudouridine1911/1915/1917 synthase
VFKIKLEAKDILYEDNHVIVILKKAGIPSQADKSGDIDALSMVKEYIKEKYNKAGNVYVGLVHRLDRMTSGIMVFAKTSKGASRLSENIRNGDFKKEYLACVEGKLELSLTTTLKDYIVKDERNNLSKIVKSTHKGAKEALLEYTVIGHIVYKDKTYSYVKIKLYTGRHHQIRVQFSNMGHPLYGDIKYGGKSGNLALFAYKLSTYHPTKDELLEFVHYPEKLGIWKELEI